MPYSSRVAIRETATTPPATTTPAADGCCLLLATLGIDLQRIHFTWISAAEGKKWQQVISDITQATRQLGPYLAYQQICEEN